MSSQNPRNVRNFWIELFVDGKKTRIATGPASKDGGFDLYIKIREKGSVSSSKNLRIRGYTRNNRIYLHSEAEGFKSDASDLGQVVIESER